MGGVNSKADGEGGEVFPQDAPSIWSHWPGPRGDAGDEDEGGLQLPPCKIISDFGTFDGPMPTGMPGGYLKEIVELPRETKPIVELPKPKEQSPVKVKEQSPKALPATENTKTEMPETEVHSAGLQELHGKRKSLLIGINYFGSSSELHGCVDDVHRMLPLVEQWGFAQEGCSQVLLDSPGHHKPPTKANIQAAIAWLVQGAAPGDTLFFHYSGHGGRVPRTDGRGEWHETLCPVDMDEAGMIHDNELFEMLVKPLPKGCRLTCILDACHSAGALDLPFIFTGTPENIKKAMTGEAIQMALSKNWVRDFELMEMDNPMALLGDVASVGFGLWDMWKQYKAKTEANQDGFCPDEPGNIGMTSAEVVAITGCASNQTSADVGDVHSQFDLKNTAHGGQIRQGGARGDAGGALTCAFIEAMEMVQSQHGPDGKVSILELLEHLQGRLAEGGFSQVPQLASSLVLDLKQPFSLTTVVGQSTGNNLSDGTSTRTLPGGAGASNGGLLGSVGNGLGTALAGSALGGCGGPMGGMGMGGMGMGGMEGMAGMAGMGGMGGAGGTAGMEGGGMGPTTSPPAADGGGFFSSLGSWSGLFGSNQENQEATAVPAGYMSGDEYDDDDDDNFGEEDFDDDYSDYDED